MPLYEYRCTQCGQRFELLRRFQDADRDLTCPRCQSEKIQRQFSTFLGRLGSAPGCGSSGGGFS